MEIEDYWPYNIRCGIENVIDKTHKGANDGVAEGERAYPPGNGDNVQVRTLYESVVGDGPGIGNSGPRDEGGEQFF